MTMCPIPRLLIRTIYNCNQSEEWAGIASTYLIQLTILSQAKQIQKLLLHMQT